DLQAVGERIHPGGVVLGGNDALQLGEQRRPGKLLDDLHRAPVHRSPQRRRDEERRLRQPEGDRSEGPLQPGAVPLVAVRGPCAVSSARGEPREGGRPVPPLPAVARSCRSASPPGSATASAPPARRGRALAPGTPPRDRRRTTCPGAPPWRASSAGRRTPRGVEAVDRPARRSPDLPTAPRG